MTLTDFKPRSVSVTLYNSNDENIDFDMDYIDYRDSEPVRLNRSISPSVDALRYTFEVGLTPVLTDVIFDVEIVDLNGEGDKMRYIPTVVPVTTLTPSLTQEVIKGLSLPNETYKVDTLLIRARARSEFANVYRVEHKYGWADAAAQFGGILGLISALTMIVFPKIDTQERATRFNIGQRLEKCFDRCGDAERKGSIQVLNRPLLPDQHNTFSDDKAE